MKHTKRFKWMVALCILFAVGAIGSIAGGETSTIIIGFVLAAVFGFLAWKFKDERYTEPEPEEIVKGDPTKKLERLLAMKEKGVISDEEFEEKKAKLMKQV